MEQILSELNKLPDVAGSCIVAEDGILVATDFHSEIDAETVGALMSSIIRASRQTIDKLDYGDIRSFMLEAEKNKLFFGRCKFGYVVVITGAEANLGLIRVEIRDRIKELESMTL
ncbi:roadblock/LC7 domain-containing protein [Candidatus Sumerlaeota bacterium]|nr:roadblock/LC7 domain-containing protein [Candidatus Sumerlaeota bacterium]